LLSAFLGRAFAAAGSGPGRHPYIAQPQRDDSGESHSGGFCVKKGLAAQLLAERRLVAMSDMLAAWSIIDGGLPPSFFGADIR